MSVHFRTLRVKIQSKKKWGTYYHYYVEIQKQVSGIQSGFGYPQVRFGDEFSPEMVFGLGSCFKLGFQFWVPRHSTQFEPNPLPSLALIHLTEKKNPHI